MAAKFHEIAFTASVRQAQERFYGRSHQIEGTRPPDALTADEAAFIRARDSFYMATVNEQGWPYLQHRGGPAGFLHVLGPQTLAFADIRGNRQLISTGNLTADDRVSLFLMDYAAQARLKVLGRARMEPAQDLPEWVAQLAPPDLAPRVERICFIDVVAYDWNCPQFITPRFTGPEIAEAVAPLKARSAELEAKLNGPHPEQP
ncbi:MAG TPA: pyridoxamine 5'-phosphate oxidase family protein [Holophagaceae bacterium]|nr:pyridoxamine 5'-phosphate oxidase family protein [Holophagaceae bacterium]